MELPNMGAIIVTGGTFGIGKAITLTLAERGFDVVAFGIEARQPSSTAENTIAPLQKKLAALGLTAEIMAADVTQSADVKRVIDFAVEKYGAIDGLVNNAAIGPLGTVPETSEEIWDQVIAVNLKGTFLCCKEVLPHMTRQKRGSIVNIGSGSGWGKPNMAAYSASKGGIFALSAALAYDHIHEGVRINTVVPGGGGMVTGMSLGRRDGDVELIKKGAAGTAAGRSTEPADIAKAVAFLMSDDAVAISGTVIDVGCFAGQGGPLKNPEGV
jgi:NAD(P)-dependent dehydrogenase (short-subunit alcohol dehydrogenase family)